MTAAQTSPIYNHAVEVLKENDLGTYTVPTKGLYPFQWNWDSCLTALGQSHYDEARAWTEIETLFAHQWPDGMVPHIVFHVDDEGYFPGPHIWETGRPVPTSGITQPPVLGFVLRRLYERARDKELAREKATALAQKADAWHRWFYANRDPAGTGLVAILHPWESADNAPRFDRALERVEFEKVPAFARSDRRHVLAAERPTDRDYARYLAIVGRLRRCGYRPTSLAEAPFAYADLSFNSVLAAADDDLAWLWTELGEDGARARAGAVRVRGALASRWDENASAYKELDLHGGEPETTGTIGDLLPLYAGVPDERRTRRLFDLALWSPARFGPSPDASWPVTTVSKASGMFDPRRYWRGPVWINVNWFLLRGLARAGLAVEAEELRQMTLRLVAASGFTEYYHPSTGEPLGSRDFSWSAALTLDLMLAPP
jgi:hypothetical protein